MSLTNFLHDLVQKFDCNISIRLQDGSSVRVEVHQVPFMGWGGLRCTRTMHRVIGEASNGEFCEFLKSHGIEVLPFLEGE